MPRGAERWCWQVVIHHPEIIDAVEDYEQLSKQVTKRYDDVISWADMFDECSMETKKMVVSQLFNKVKIGKEYTFEIDMNVSYDMFSIALAEIPLKAEVKVNGVAAA